MSNHPFVTAPPRVPLRTRLQHAAASSGAGPKVDTLVTVLRDHFEQAAAEQLKESRAMVFTSMRDGVAGIVAALNALPGSVVSARCAPLPCMSYNEGI